MSLTAEQATTRAWAIRRFYRAGAVDRRAALTSLSLLERHANPRVVRLAQQVIREIVS